MHPNLKRRTVFIYSKPIDLWECTYHLNYHRDFSEFVLGLLTIYAHLSPKAQQLSVHTTSARFQLDCMGHLLKRETRTDRDQRVDHFIPDTWQVLSQFFTAY